MHAINLGRLVRVKLGLQLVPWSPRNLKTSCLICAGAPESNWRFSEGLLTQRRKLAHGVVQVDGEGELRIGVTMEGF